MSALGTNKRSNSLPRAVPTSVGPWLMLLVNVTSVLTSPKPGVLFLDGTRIFLHKSP